MLLAYYYLRLCCHNTSSACNLLVFEKGEKIVAFNEITNRRSFKQFARNLSVLVKEYDLTLRSTSLKPAERNGTRGWPFALY